MTFQQKSLSSFRDFFLTSSQRGGGTVYGYRLHGYHQDLGPDLAEYYQQAQATGLVVVGRLPNPSQGNLDYYHQMIGEEFHMNVGFFAQKLTLWLPRLTPEQNRVLSTAIYDTLFEMQKAGKNPSILKNIFIKFMCWMYYRLERLLRQLGGDQLPKILYEGEVSNYELRLFSVLSLAGCDVLLLGLSGEDAYKTVDPTSAYTRNFDLLPLAPFPSGFSLANIQQEQAQQQRISQLYRPGSALEIVPNGWRQGTPFQDILTPANQRGSGENQAFPCYRALVGVADKAHYLPELYRFYQELQSAKRPLVVLEEIPVPTPEEISQISRKNYQTVEDLLQHLGSSIVYTPSAILENALKKAFVETILWLSDRLEHNMNRLTSRAVPLLCLLKRYQGQLLPQNEPLGCLIYLNGGYQPSEEAFLVLLSHLPVDVLLLNPDLSRPPTLPAVAVVEQGEHSLAVAEFPTGAADVQMGTVAYHAERELDSLMYTDSGLYRNQQYHKAVTVALKTMYEEIAILWDQEVKFRPNFEVVGEVVQVPTLFAKVSGIKEEKITDYWGMIRRFVTPETFVISQPPFCRSQTPHPLTGAATKFWKNGKLQRQEILAHSGYTYGFLRQECQHHILDKLELLLQENIIKGTGANGMEYHIIGLVLNLDQSILRLLGRMDFTQKNSKLVYVHTKEVLPPVEDAIMLAFLHLVGLDILLFVPTGYQGVEAHYNKDILVEHQVGGYQYGLTVPDLGKSPWTLPHTWKNKIFKRGGT